MIFTAAWCGGASIAGWAHAREPSPCRPEQWREAIEKFQKQDAAQAPPRDAVLFVGSSSIVMWDVKKSFPELTTINRGFGGSQICDSTHYADVLVAKHSPRIVVFYAGDNDIAGGKTAAQVHDDFRAFVAKVRESLPTTPIVYIAIKPSFARWKLRETMQAANRLIAADCERDDALEFVDVWPRMLDDEGLPRKEIFRDDGLHMNESGYKIWSELLRPHLKQQNDEIRNPNDE